MKIMVSSIASVDILIAAQHEELVNLLWMRPHSVLIQVFSPFCIDFYSFHLSQLARLHFIAVTDFDYEHCYEEKDVMDGWLAEGELDLHAEQLQNARPDPNHFQIVSAVKDAIEYVKNMASLYILNDFWSPIFYSFVCLMHFLFFDLWQN